MKCGDTGMNELRATTHMCSVCGSINLDGEACTSCQEKAYDEEHEDTEHYYGADIGSSDDGSAVEVTLVCGCIASVKPVCGCGDS